MASSELRSYNLTTHTGEGSVIQALKLVHTVNSLDATRVGVDMRLSGTSLTACFSVRSDCPSYLNSKMPLTESQWGLWDWDVIEVFVSCSRSASRTPYYEFQVSPLNQFLELEIHEPRKVVNRDWVSGFRHSANRTNPDQRPGDWDGELTIPLDQLGWDGDPSSITGNAFAILGPREARTYWSLFLAPQAKPDFHLPLEFKRLV